MTRPLIGISAPLRRLDTEHGTDLPYAALGTDYIEAVEAAGGIPIVLPPIGDPAQLAARLDGLVLSGGGDVDPTRYGGRPEPGVEYSAQRDGFELELARAARDLNIPTLGICRGHQVVNVALGGTLVVDLGTTSVHAPLLDAERQFRVRHDVTLAPDSRLAGVYGVTRRAVNSLHHQAVGRVAEGLVAVAQADDGVVEAVEATDGWDYVGVQWHPEKLSAPEEWAFELALFRRLVAAASAGSPAFEVVLTA
ncbi:gamma-glutamyl-gamma-aminobutyrate hydrolase family protein [Microbacterium paludicola]|uniref:Gamma-glutamyl-gamma-aminobutyrate hydrolase family protein n=1 Tax=Microbacterium paludicola TaxID=300019 RepID=A0A4Y9FVJ5_9MICO|nr:gamma-glutamyl-gamma-aminobutyrate hydrolase family protein [Microbacterium paludicola]MBF0817053.1 gamma-glutamyl-gamma-aminobutyrate hydrolase family protein [Microbacterium paludicola]TFU32247.1 gamma-glutamyl-gamma-aminobutyrate hydrolase family protein [Microbacterium paludicola]